MARDIEEFLRRAAERRKQQKQGGAKPPQQRQPPAQRQQPPRQRLQQTPRQRQPPPVEAEIVEDVTPVSRRRQNPKPQQLKNCLLYTSPSPRDRTRSRMPSSA